MKADVWNSSRPVVFLSREDSLIGNSVKFLAKRFGVEWRTAPEYPLSSAASVVLVAPTNDPKVLEELSSKCGVWNAKTMTACACYELILDKSPKVADKAAVDNCESLTDWFLSEYFFYGRNEFCFEGPENLSMSELEMFETTLAQTIRELIKCLEDNKKREKDKR